MGRLRKVISGGQTGVDRAGLDAARVLGIEIGGHCPRGRRAEDGRIPDIYPLEETPESNYKVRTSLNVLNSDATLIYWTDEDEKKSRGTGYTIKLCRQARKPWFDVLVISNNQA